MTLRRLAPLLILAACREPAASASDPLALVDPFIGTGGKGFGVGSIAPGPKVPFGMANPSPDTATNGGAPGFSHCAGYHHEDDQIRGFSQIHLSGTGVPDYGVLLIQPMTEVLGERTLGERAYIDRLDHRRERASVGEYAVHLLDADVEVEITATARTALYRLTYPEGRPALLVVNLDHGLGGGKTTGGSLRVEGGDLVGSLHHLGDLSARYGGFDLFFAIRIAKTSAVRLYSDGVEVSGATSIEGARSAAIVELLAEEPVLVEVGLSFVDVESARSELSASPAFEGTRDAAREAWRRILSKIRIEGGSDPDREKLYTSLYHAYQMPTLLEGSDGRHRGMGGVVGRSDGFTYYSDFSLWDTFRTAHPLFSLLTPEIQADFNASLVAMLETSGHLGRWPLAHGETWTMLGNHGESMLIDAHLRGVGGFDVERTYAHLAAAAMAPIDANGVARAGRECIDRYVAIGFCPADGGGDSTSETLENAYNDWMLANLAEDLGHADDAERFRARSRSWTHHFNPETGYLQAKLADGTFAPDFDDELFSEDFVEGNARQWSVYVPYDVAHLAERMGGTEVLAARLDAFFENTRSAEKTIFPDLWYWHGNEVDIHAPYMFGELGRRDLIEKWVSWIMDARYGNGPDGLDGNDDGGTLSAWYVFSALGFFPLAGSDRYIIGVPRFDRVELELEDHTLVIRRREDGEVALDGVRVEGPHLRHDDLVRARELDL